MLSLEMCVCMCARRFGQSKKPTTDDSVPSACWAHRISPGPADTAGARIADTRAGTPARTLTATDNNVHRTPARSPVDYRDTFEQQHAVRTYWLKVRLSAELSTSLAGTILSAFTHVSGRETTGQPVGDNRVRSHRIRLSDKCHDIRCTAATVGDWLAGHAGPIVFIFELTICIMIVEYRLSNVRADGVDGDDDGVDVSIGSAFPLSRHEHNAGLHADVSHSGGSRQWP